VATALTHTRGRSGKQRPRSLGSYGLAIDKLIFGERGAVVRVCCVAATGTPRVCPHFCEACSGMQSGLGGATLVAATLPFHAQRAVVLLVAVALLGIFCGVAFGSRYSTAARETVVIEQLVDNQIANKSAS
jgi:hypothetical protein